jgi:hypothetical protein
VAVTHSMKDSITTAIKIRPIFSLNYWVFGLLSSSDILETRKHDFRKLDLFPSSGQRGEIPTQLGTLERVNLNPF